MSDSCVYIRDKAEAWLPANIVSQDGDKCLVKVFSVSGDEEANTREVSLADYSNKALPLQNVDVSGHLMEMADMVDLPSLHEVGFVSVLFHLSMCAHVFLCCVCLYFVYLCPARLHLLCVHTAGRLISSIHPSCTPLLPPFPSTSPGCHSLQPQIATHEQKTVHKSR